MWAPRLMRRVFGAPKGHAVTDEVCSTERRNVRRGFSSLKYPFSWVFPFLILFLLLYFYKNLNSKRTVSYTHAEHRSKCKIKEKKNSQYTYV